MADFAEWDSFCVIVGAAFATPGQQAGSKAMEGPGEGRADGSADPLKFPVSSPTRCD